MDYYHTHAVPVVTLQYLWSTLLSALINIQATVSTAFPVSGVANVARTRIAPLSVRTRRLAMAVVRSKLALIDVIAASTGGGVLSVASVASNALTCVTSCRTQAIRAPR